MIFPSHTSSRQKVTRNLSFYFGAVVLAWLLSKSVVSGDVTGLLIMGLAISAVSIGLWILGNWKRGFYIFLIYMVCEDLIRKYMGNGTLLFFGKDLLLAISYISMLRALRRKQLDTYRPFFVLPMAILLGWGLIQVFNPNSPSPLYGALGIKLYFYYVPLAFAGYALVRTELDLQKFLTLNLWIALIVGGLGIAQSIVGLQFLNPTTLAPDIRGLGSLVRYSPITHLAVPRPTSIFVSDGRFAQFLTLMYLLAFGTLGYEFALRKRLRPLTLCAVGVAIVATIQTGSRSAFLLFIAFTIAIIVGFPRMGVVGIGRHLRLGRVIRGVVLIGAVAVASAALLFPEAIAARWAFYMETLSPTSSVSELGYRTWVYPVENLELVFSQRHWAWGNGIGTATLGGQYVSHFLGQQPPGLGSESGPGMVILELGILGLILWTIWTVHFLIEQGKTLRTLRGTPYAALGFCIWLFSVYVIGFGSIYGIIIYLNYFNNAYFWILAGLSARLIVLARQSQSSTKTSSAAHQPNPSWIVPNPAAS